MNLLCNPLKCMGFLKRHFEEPKPLGEEDSPVGKNATELTDKSNKNNENKDDWEEAEWSGDEADGFMGGNNESKGSNKGNSANGKSAPVEKEWVRKDLQAKKADDDMFADLGMEATYHGTIGVDMNAPKKQISANKKPIAQQQSQEIETAGAAWDNEDIPLD